MRTVMLARCIVAAGGLIPVLALADVPLHEQLVRRHPVAAALSQDGRWLYVVNHEAGSLSTINLDAGRVVREERLGHKLSDVAALPDGRLLLTDQAAHELLVVEPGERAAVVQQRIPVARSPVNVAVSPDGRSVTVAGLWSRRVTLLKQAEKHAAAELGLASLPASHFPAATWKLPFSPRWQRFFADGRRLVVADAFGGLLAVIDLEHRQVESVRTLPAQNIRGMEVSHDGNRLLLTHQVLSPLARADFDDIHWGNLVRNVMREVAIDVLRDPQADLLDGARTVPLGEVGRGAADPAGFAQIPALEGWVVCLAGTGEVKVQTRFGGGRIAVGSQPVGVVWDDRRAVAYVVCRLDDSVVVVNPVAQTVTDRVSLGPQPKPTPADRGEQLFSDGSRSHDGWLSCQSCHPGGHTTGRLADTSSDTTYGTPKRILSLLGTRDTNPWAWNGEFRELHEQVASSFTTTLQGDALPTAQVSDVVGFLHTLTAPPPVDEGEWSDEQLAQIATGRQLFNHQRCGRCHVPPQTFTTDQMFDVGLEDEQGLQKFNPPSLRGLSQRQRYFHDGRADSLEAVFAEFGHQLDEPLREEQMLVLLMYLRSL